MTRVYVAGAGGMLGRAFYEEFGSSAEARCTDIDLNEDWLAYVDVRDLEAYRDDVQAFRPDVLMHLAALTDLEYCEKHPDEAYATNAVGAENATYIATALDIPLVYVSTAGVFDGTHDHYDDWDVPNPLGVYARAKYAGEQAVRHNSRRPLICRAGWMMGGGPAKDKKFIKKLMVQLRDGATELFVVDDKHGTPTYTRDFARNVALLLEHGYWGLYNMVCSGAATRLDVAWELLRVLGLENEVKLRSVGSEHFADSYFAPRPEHEGLLNRKLALRGLDAMRPWRDALADYIATDWAGYLT